MRVTGRGEVRQAADRRRGGGGGERARGPRAQDEALGTEQGGREGSGRKENAPQPELGGVSYFTGRTWLGPMAVIHRLGRSRR